jgi:NADH-quinone oxidoreductase subunit N
MVLLVAGFGFKVAGVPFHMWSPDAYEGAPTPITAFMSTGVKAAAFAGALRVFADGLAPAHDQWMVIIAAVAIASLVIGNTVAIAQTNIKRMLAYSSIGHGGYAMLGLVTGTAEGVAGVVFYMLAYTFMNAGAFAIIIMMKGGGKTGEEIEDYRGLAKNHKGLALVLLVLLFSLAGIPPTAGFMGKFYIFMALIHQEMYVLAVVAIITSAVAAYFYIRIVMLMYMKEPEGEFEFSYSRALIFAVAVTTIAVLVLGVYPNFIIELAEKATFLL